MSDVKYYNLLFDISKKLDELNDIERLQYMCKGKISPDNQNNNNTRALFDELEEQGHLGIDCLDVLREMLNELEEWELLSKVVEFESTREKVKELEGKSARILSSAKWAGGKILGAVKLHCNFRTIGGAVVVVGAVVILRKCSTLPEFMEAFTKIVLPTTTKLCAISDGSVCFTVQAENLSALQVVWQQYQDGMLQKNLQDFLITEEIKLLADGQDVMVTVNIDEQEYKEACLDLMITETKVLKKEPLSQRRRRNSDSILHGRPRDADERLWQLRKSELPAGEAKEKHMEPETRAYVQSYVAQLPDSYSVTSETTDSGRWSATSMFETDSEYSAITRFCESTDPRVEKRKAVATAKTTKKTVARRDSIMDVANDLSLLRVLSATDDYPTVLRMEQRRAQRIDNLRQTNGSLAKRYDRIVNDVVKTSDRRRILKVHYEKLKEVLKETQAVGPEERDHFLSLAEDCIQDLHNKRYTVLIVGETNSGKSSLINLLLGETVLPTDTLANTFTICEISYGAKKMAVIRFANPGREPKTLKGKTFGQLTDLINKGKDDEDHCERIEIKLPHPLLKCGVVIVDSPGIGDSLHDGKKAMNYMSQAFAFVYVINSSNAGGLQEERLLRLLSKWNSLYESRHRGISAKSALFVCNKWDQVEEEEKEKVQRDTISKLKNMIPDLDLESQVMEISVKEASKVQHKFSVVLEDFSDFMSGLQRLIPLCIEEKMEYFYCLISGQLRNLSDQVKGDIRNAKSSQEERVKTQEEVQTKLEKLKQRTHIREIEDAISDHIRDICDRLVSYLVLSDVKRAFCTWEEQDVPLKDLQKASATRIKEAFDRCVAKRFQSIIDTWERKEKLLSQAHDDLAKRFDRGFYDLEKSIHDIDRTLAGQSTDEFQVFNPETFRTPNNPRMKKFLVLTLGIFMPVLFPVGLAAGVLSAPNFGYLAIAKHLEERKLKSQSCESLAEMSIEFLESFIKHEVRNRIQEEFSEEKKRVAGIKRCYHELITKYEQKCNDLLTRSESESTDRETLQRYSALDEKLRKMNENLTFDAIEHGVRPMYSLCQIDKRNLCYGERDLLGGGVFGKVFKGKLSLPGRHGNKDVAVKKLSEPPQPSNVDWFLQEAANMMQLNHKHIVTFHGVVIDVRQHELRSLVFVFEMCLGTLKDHIFENNNHIPWKTPSAAQDTLHWAEDILDALMFIHAKHIVHRDLKLDNVLISQHRHIKVADLGLACVEGRITGTICGTPLYVAPEVFDSKAYGTKADMYSFGLIMWEMWYGKQVFSEIRSLPLQEFLRQIKDKNYRPQFPTSEGRPNPTLSKWIDVMKRCWDGEPIARPTATECKDLIAAIPKQ